MNFAQIIELIALNTVTNLLCIIAGHVLAKPWLDRRLLRKPTVQLAQKQIP